MNWDQMEGGWTQMKGKVQEQWGKLTDDDLTAIAGDRNQLVGTLQARYGWAKEKAEEQVKRFASQMSEAAETTRERAGQKLQEAGQGLRNRMPREGYIGNGVDAVAGAIENTGQYIENQNFSDMASDFGDVIKRHPIPAILVAIGLGYMIGRGTTWR